MLSHEQSAEDPDSDVGQNERKLTVWEKIIEIGNSIPDEELARMPRDGAANHDHYLYGWRRAYARWSFEETAMALNIEIIEARVEQRGVLGALMELYQYDFTEYTAEDVGDDGRFGFDRLNSYFEEAARHAHLVRVDGHWAGFALVREGVEFLDGRAGTDMAEFFVMRKYRRAGVGERVAKAMFEAYPGLWQVRVMEENAPAREFWADVIDRYADRVIEPQNYDDDRWRGPVQFFDSVVR